MRLIISIICVVLIAVGIAIANNESIYANIFSNRSSSQTLKHHTNYNRKPLSISNLTEVVLDDDSVPNPIIPENVLYESIFLLDISFRRKALLQELSGEEDVTLLKHYFKENAGLTNEEEKLLEKISIERIGT